MQSIKKKVVFILKIWDFSLYTGGLIYFDGEKYILTKKDQIAFGPDRQQH